jgi:trehalose synthase
VLHTVNAGHRSLADYYSIVSRDLMAEIRALAEPLAGKRVLHINATAFGGGVAEILFTMVPLMNDVGLQTEWKVLFGREEFFHVTKALHNALQGSERGLTEDEKRIFERYNLLNAGGLSEQYDFIVIHDPQPAAIKMGAEQERAKWVWRCHIDISTPNTEVLDFLMPYIESYDLSVFHMARYIPNGGRAPDPVVIPPAIDPLTPKNMALSAEDAAYIVDQFGIDVDRPLITQVSRFDPWKDPVGVIEAWRLVRVRHPTVQLGLVGSMAHDDPEGWEYYNKTVEAAAGDPDIFILSNLNNVGSVEVNAFQVHSAALVQKSIREGFGLTVTEALWKVRPIVAGRAGGILDQVRDGETGFLVDSIEQCATACEAVLDDPGRARNMALLGKEHVRQRFLTPRLVRDWLALFNRLDGNDAGADRLVVANQRAS